MYFLIRSGWFYAYLCPQEEGADVETAGDDGSGQTRVETIHQWPMFRKEYKGLTNYALNSTKY